MFYVKSIGCKNGTQKLEPSHCSIFVLMILHNVDAVINLKVT